MISVANGRSPHDEHGEGGNGCQADSPGTPVALGGDTRILVIRLSALGDFILALPAMAAIRRHHPAAHITLMTASPLAELGRRSGWFDTVILDTRPRWTDPSGWLSLRRRLRAGRFDRVYDLQAQDRTALYYRLFWPGPWPEWSGIVPRASHPHLDPARRRMHAHDIHRAQLAIAGIGEIPLPDLRWLDDPALPPDLPDRFVMLVPGSAAHRPAKRWPIERFAALAARLAAKGQVPLIVGTEGERPLADRIRADCPTARDFTGQTSLFQVAALARRATAAIGNDTGPMHVAAAVGCNAVVLFSGASDPARSAPRGPHVRVLQRPDLAELAVEDVLEDIF